MNVVTLRFSLIIPAYNEAGYLPSLLDSVDIARSNYRGGRDAIEVLVCDNNSTDGTAELARERGCRVIGVAPRIIAAVRNAGAVAAQGDILAFLDADSLIHPNTFNVIAEAMGTGQYIGGATGISMDRMSLGIAATVLLFLPLVWMTGMDTGVVFCRRDDFNQLGGYDERRIFAEDADFLWRLRSYGRSLGRSASKNLVRLKGAKAITSARKFDQHGDWHYFPLMVRALIALLFCSSRYELFTRNYWYPDERPMPARPNPPVQENHKESK